MIRIQYQTADGLKQYARIPKIERRIYRKCMSILVLDGEERPQNELPTFLTTKREYVLWTLLKNGTPVYLEDDQKTLAPLRGKE